MWCDLPTEPSIRNHSVEELWTSGAMVRKMGLAGPYIRIRGPQGRLSEALLDLDVECVIIKTQLSCIGSQGDDRTVCWSCWKDSS